MAKREVTLKKIYVLFSKILNLKNDPWLSLWISRFGLYITLFGFVAFFGTLIINGYHATPTNYENALYFLSSMVQVQAAVVALVITLTLIAIQMMAASYTPRVIDVMKKNPDMWFLLVIYLESISIGFIVLKQVGNPDPSIVSSVLILGIYTFLALFLYMINIINLLRPDEIVTRLVLDINSGNICQKNESDDIMQPVFDVVHASINRFDLTTTRTGLNQLHLRLLEILPECNKTAKKKIISSFVHHINRSLLIAQQNEDEGAMNVILSVLEHFSLEICKYEELNDELFLVVVLMHKIGIDAIDKGFKYAPIFVIDALEEVGIQGLDTGSEFAIIEISGLLDFIGVYAADKNLQEITSKVIISLEEIGKHIIDKKMEIKTEFVTSGIMEISKHAIDKGLVGTTIEGIDTLEKIGVYATDKENAIGAALAIVTLEKIGVYATNSKLQNVIVNVVDSLTAVGIHAANKGLLELTDCTCYALTKISADAINRGKEAAACLQHLGVHTAEENALNNAITLTSTIIDKLWIIGKHAVEIGLEEVLVRVELSLEKISNQASGDKALKNIIVHIIEVLEVIGDNASGNSFDVATYGVFEIIVNIGDDTANKGLLEVSGKAEDALVRVCENASRTTSWFGDSPTLGQDYLVLIAKKIKFRTQNQSSIELPRNE